MMFISAEQIAQALTYADCIKEMRAAMAQLSSGETKQMLRQILPLDQIGRASCRDRV